MRNVLLRSVGAPLLGGLSSLLRTPLTRSDNASEIFFRMIAARRLAGARPYLAAVAGIVHHEDRWQLYRDELTGADVRVDGWISAVAGSA
jgi:hypothetical protein